MTPTEAENAMVSQFIADWAGQTPILLANQEDEPPEDTAAWVRISVQHNDGEQAAIGGQPGNQLFRSFGLVFVQVFVPKGTATNQLNDLAYDAKLVFEGKTIDGIWFRYCRITDVPIEAGTKWAQKNSVAEFIYDDIH